MKPLQFPVSQKPVQRRQNFSIYNEPTTAEMDALSREERTEAEDLETEEEYGSVEDIDFFGDDL